MRIALLVFVLCLSACAAQPQPDPPPPSAGKLASAEWRCLKQGFRKGSFEYDSCYRNSPEVEYYERTGRLAYLGIIRKNRSPRSVKGRSIPVE